MAVQLPQKIYFRIGEVAKILGVAPHVIRFWETEFKTVRPQKSRTGQRVYARRDVEQLVLIRRLLKEERYTIEGARKYLRDRGHAPAAPATEPAPSRADVLRAALLATRAKLEGFLASLPPVGPASAPPRSS